MKQIYILLLAVAAAVATTSCEKWLDVNPADEVTEEDLFKVGTGYRNALNGIYKTLGSSALYGRELTWGMADVMGQCYDSYDFPNKHVYTEFVSFAYTSDKAKAIISGLWSQAYNAIANCNNIIGSIEAEPDAKFLGGKLEKDLILGEALALRGFIHFVVLSYFAPAPCKESTENWIPYYEEFPSTGAPYLTIDETIERIVRDLKRGCALVEPFDTYVSEDGRENHTLWLTKTHRFYANTGLGSAATELFYAFRGYRMNILSIGALLARVYSYAGQTELAAAEARRVIDFKSTYSGAYDVFEFTSPGKVAGDYKMCDDLIFALSDINLIKNYELFTTGDGAVQFSMDYNYRYLFDSDSDYRKTTLLNISGYSYKPRRYTTPSAAGSSETYDILPVIRLSELYYILAEDYAAQGDWANATAMLETVRKGRNCGANMLSGAIKNESTFTTELLDEVRREYTEEGLTFFFYKKHDVKFSRSMKDQAFYFPLPDNETVN